MRLKKKMMIDRIFLGSLTSELGSFSSNLDHLLLHFSLQGGKGGIVGWCDGRRGDPKRLMNSWAIYLLFAGGLGLFLFVHQRRQLKLDAMVFWSCCLWWWCVDGQVNKVKGDTDTIQTGWWPVNWVNCPRIASECKTLFSSLTSLWLCQNLKHLSGIYLAPIVWFIGT